MAANRDKDLPELFREFVQRENLFCLNDRLLVAVSGGVDSVVLCELCHLCGYSFDIAHCNYQLRGDDSMRDEDFVKSLGPRYDVEVYIKRVELRISGSSKSGLQEKARDARYSWFEKLLIENPAKYHSVLTAHHQGDEVETVLMNFLKGTGIAGLQGIKPDQPFNGINHLQRPLLFANKSMLIEFAGKAALPFRTDSSNNSNDYTRNFIRNEILPLLAARMPSVEANILNNVSRFRDVQELYSLAIAKQLKSLIEEHGKEYRVPVLKLLKSPAVNTVIYELFRRFGFTTAQGRDIFSLLNAETGKYVLSSTHRILRNRAWLVVSKINSQAASEFIIDSPGATIKFPGGELKFSEPHAPSSVETDPNTAFINTQDLSFPILLRKWKQGDYFYPLGMRKKKKLSRFFIDQKMSMIEKENTWVLESAKRIVWVVGRRIDDRFRIIPSITSAIKIVLAPAE